MKRRNVVSLLLCLLMLLSIVPSYAAPDVSGAFKPDETLMMDLYASIYGWDKSLYYADEWGNGAYKRQAGYQTQFQQDMVMTTLKYLGEHGIDVTEEWSIGGMGEIIEGNGGSIVEVAMRQIGVSETIDSRGGQDDVGFNTWYYGGAVRNSDTNGNGRYDYGDSKFYPWCCVFVVWCANQCGYINDGTFCMTAGCGTLYNYLTGSKGFGSVSVSNTTPMGGSAYTPQPGDIMFFANTEGSDPFSHVGIVVSVGADGFYTVEGNSGNKVSHNFYNSSSGYSARNGRIVHVIYPEGGATS